LSLRTSSNKNFAAIVRDELGQMTLKICGRLRMLDSGSMTFDGVKNPFSSVEAIAHASNTCLKGYPVDCFE
jgi:hypothetical protein